MSAAKKLTREYFYQLTPFSRRLQSLSIEVVYVPETLEIVQLLVPIDPANCFEVEDKTEWLIRHFGKGLIDEIRTSLEIWEGIYQRRSERDGA